MHKTQACRTPTMSKPMSSNRLRLARSVRLVIAIIGRRAPRSSRRRLQISAPSLRPMTMSSRMASKGRGASISASSTMSPSSSVLKVQPSISK